MQQDVVAGAEQHEVQAVGYAPLGVVLPSDINEGRRPTPTVEGTETARG